MRLSGMNDELRERLANDPNAMVMEPTYDHVFEPWPKARVRAALDAVQALAVAHDKAEVDRQVQLDTELREFAKLHGKIYEHASNPAMARNPELMRVVHEMLNLRQRVIDGSLSDTDARASVSDTALAAVMKHMEEAKASGGAATPASRAD